MAVSFSVFFGVGRDPGVGGGVGSDGAEHPGEGVHFGAAHPRADVAREVCGREHVDESGGCCGVNGGCVHCWFPWSIGWAR